MDSVSVPIVYLSESRVECPYIKSAHDFATAAGAEEVDIDPAILPIIMLANPESIEEIADKFLISDNEIKKIALRIFLRKCNWDTRCALMNTMIELGMHAEFQEYIFSQWTNKKSYNEVCKLIKHIDFLLAYPFRNKEGASMFDTLCRIPQISDEELGTIADRLSPEQLNNVTDYNSTTFMFACEFGREAIAERLLPTTNLDAITEDGNTCLMYACKGKLSKIALTIIAMGKGMCDKINNYGVSALLYAIEQNIEDVSDAIITTNKGNISKLTHKNTTALIEACLFKRKNIAKKILESGECDTKFMAIMAYKTARDYAVMNGWTDIVSLIDATATAT